MLSVQLTRGLKTRQFVVRDIGVAGWEVREEIDEQPVRTVHYLDWHRVERAVALINRTVDRLEEDGWSLCRHSRDTAPMLP